MTSTPPARQSVGVRRWLIPLLTLAVLALGSGALEYAHNHQRIGDKLAPAHDESTCFLHSQLRAPMQASVNVPLLVLAGLFVAFLTELAPQPVSRRFNLRLDCRGPPAC